MPIYAYRCATCGHAQDVLQKLSDAVLTVCPACGASTYAKQVTAAGFQLKGSGWYVTDFRGGNAAKPEAEKGEKGEKADKSEPAKGEGKPADGKAAEGAAPGPAPAPAPAAEASTGKAATPPAPSPPSPAGGSGS